MIFFKTPGELSVNSWLRSFFEFESLFRCAPTVEIDFDETTGKPIIPTLVADPALYEKINHAIPKWDKDENKRKQLDDILKIKHREWNERETRRKLVD